MTAKNIPTFNILKTTLTNLLGVKKMLFFLTEISGEKRSAENDGSLGTDAKRQKLAGN